MTTKRNTVKTAKTRLSRRHFLFAAGAATAATVTATRRRDDGDVAASPAVAESREGYRVTAHIRNYYRTART